MTDLDQYAVSVPGPNQTFALAARRHHADAVFLHDAGRLANADHLAGFAAECALKAILVEYLGGEVNPNGPPTHRDLPNREFRHLPGVWNLIGMVAQGRGGAQFLPLIQASNPFSLHRWNVNERYSDGRHISAARVRELLEVARNIIAIYAQAQINGQVP
ncbi:HEPN domain-containing protein [Goodfellowiella coeruleoviolacea]|uniref:HEPN domain-containing protein n=1 Tax=Goodfellowiella coeruleoviolacea TaxID=334858 RepID=A0AAE3KF42_9PSEU|nr:hypothetical protein [Goodfellowiella coeruleoviolacea]MCP2164557.1 hypothetical protein [Goodfellowiella coeruleoviolacea]